MSAVVLPFPRSRDVAFVRRHADHLRGFKTTLSADRYLQHQLQIQAATMARKGVPDLLIAQEILALEAASRRQCRQSPATPSGVA